VQDRGGALFEPVEGAQYEAGIKGEYFDGLLNASLALFQLTESGRAVQDPDFPAGGIYLPGGKLRSRGIDAQAGACR